ncbi:hypothetical protein KCG43_20700 [Photobacterium sp. WH24]|uniref:hypothetical protein n=1 Tax=Photobacterium sp. WH24 TaxID=2827237 RepID=UPI001C47A8A4|nr:hypothetical protein [Photobacterium sp. WH24]MBV7264436.1 hypothetical protein [Photobacterium sp. WH24]
MSYEFVGYHGTDSNCVASIQEQGFALSKNPDDWLGCGVYFFAEGISEPIPNAIEWAKNQAYDSRTGSNKYESYTVLEAAVTGVRVLNTTTNEGLKVYNVLRDALLEKHNKYFTKNRRFKDDDRIMWDLVALNMSLDVVIHNLYIKNKMQRVKKICSNVPNTTVMCVKNSSLIDRNSVKEVAKGEVC